MKYLARESVVIVGQVRHGGSRADMTAAEQT